MGFIIKCLGSAAVLAFALALLRGYKAYLAKRREECDGFLAVIEAVRDGVNYFLSPLGRIFERFCDGKTTLSKISERIRDGESPKDAFEKEKRGLHIGECGKEILSNFFSALGRGYKDGVVALSEACRAKFEEYSENCRQEDEKSARLAATLAFGGALALIILFI